MRKRIKIRSSAHARSSPNASLFDLFNLRKITITPGFEPSTFELDRDHEIDALTNSATTAGNNLMSV